jgi:hypothetical protein
MNDQQKLVLCLTVLVAIGLGLFPPWQGKEKAGDPFRYVSHRFIFPGPSVAVIGNRAYRAFAEKTHYAKRFFFFGVWLSSLLVWPELVE